MTDEPKPTPIPYDEITPGYYWAQFTGPLEIVMVVDDLEGHQVVYIFGSGHFRLKFEFRFWQRIEVPNVPF